MSKCSTIRRNTINTILKYYREKKKITMLTAYDYSTAKYLDEAGVDILLIGDSLAMVVLGYENTFQITTQEMSLFTKAVAKGSSKSLVVSDMPFLSYQLSKKDALLNASKLIKSGAQAVKVEGASDDIIENIKFLTDNGIAVMGHLGFTPQYLNTIGGYNIQGKSFEKTKKIFNDAQKLEKAGVFGIVLEMVPQESAKFITEKLSIPTIGIGAGIDCSGQVLVVDDILGKYPNFVPKFAKQYANISEIILDSAKKYVYEVENSLFPNNEHSFELDKQEREKLENYCN